MEGIRRQFTVRENIMRIFYGERGQAAPGEIFVVGASACRVGAGDPKGAWDDEGNQ